MFQMELGIDSRWNYYLSAIETEETTQDIWVIFWKDRKMNKKDQMCQILKVTVNVIIENLSVTFSNSIL